MSKLNLTQINKELDKEAKEKRKQLTQKEIDKLKKDKFSTKIVEK